MGILDDAIRQHLELKRRQGAADDELARLEGEAFGPPTRPGEPDFPSAEAVVETPAPGEPEASAEAEQIEIAVEPDEAQEPAAVFEETAGPAAVVAEPPAAQGEVALDELDLELEDEFSELGEPEPDAPPASSSDTVEHTAPVESLDTVEHTVEGVPEGDESAHADTEGSEEEEALEGEDLVDGEDVLEETPEFLRDQPEDDELWFEQGEPKDFDF